MSDKTELDIDAERASFEAATPGYSHLRFEDGIYRSPIVADCWNGWLLARRATIQPTAAEPVAWGKCIWCEAPSTTRDRACSAPDGDGHMFKRVTAPVAPADAVRDARDWISVADRMPDVGDLVLVYSPPTKYDHPGEVNIGFDCMDPDADEPSWLNHNENYEHFCCVAKPEGSIGPSAEAPYTHWMPLPAAPTETPKEPAK